MYCRSCCDRDQVKKLIKPFFSHGGVLKKAADLAKLINARRGRSQAGVKAVKKATVRELERQ